MTHEDKTKDVLFEERVLKAAAALYRVTDFLSEDEPLKWKMRKDTIELIDCIVKSEESENDPVSNFERAFQVSRQLAAKLTVAEAGGYIAKINFQVLGQEYAHISDMLLEKMSFISSMRQKSLSDISIGQIYKRHTMRSEQEHQIIFSEEVNQHTSSLRKKYTSRSSSMSERQERLRNALQEKGWLYVAEIVFLCGSGVSVKTVQRDLNALVQNGKVQSRGERRWRKYALVENYERTNT